LGGWGGSCSAKRALTPCGFLQRVARQLVYLPVVAQIAAIDIAKNIRLDRRVIKRRVEGRHLIGCTARNLDLRELFIPRRLRISPHLVKVPAWDLGFEILARTDRKSTRLNSSHVKISYAVFC